MTRNRLLISLTILFTASSCALIDGFMKGGTSSSSRASAGDSSAPTDASDEQRKLANWSVDCTFNGSVSQPCVAFKRDVVNGSQRGTFPSEAREQIASCFAEAKSWEELPDSRDNDPENAQRLIVSQGEGRDGTNSEYAEECIRVAARHYGQDWLGAARRAGLFAAMRTLVNKGFEDSCGVRGELMQAGDPPKMALWDKPKKGVMFKNLSDATGNQVTVSCNGKVQARGASGKIITVAAVSAQGEIANRGAACVNDCQMREPICSESARRGTAPSAQCAAVCRSRCK